MDQIVAWVPWIIGVAFVLYVALVLYAWRNWNGHRGEYRRSRQAIDAEIFHRSRRKDED